MVDEGEDSRSQPRQGILPGLDTSDVEITRPSVTIRVLRVDKRKVTQTLLRQLPRERMVDEVKVELLGNPWGWVNVKFAKPDKARQFIVQFGNRLRRCPFVIQNRTESAAEWPQEWQKPLRQFLASQGVAVSEPWEFLIEKDADAVRDYIERWNALMDRLRLVEQLFIGL
jgi:hypothetical protein